MGAVVVAVEAAVVIVAAVINSVSQTNRLCTNRSFKYPMLNLSNQVEIIGDDKVLGAASVINSAKVNSPQT